MPYPPRNCAEVANLLVDVSVCPWTNVVEVKADDAILNDFKRAAGAELDRGIEWRSISSDRDDSLKYDLLRHFVTNQRGVRRLARRARTWLRSCACSTIVPSKFQPAPLSYENVPEDSLHSLSLICRRRGGQMRSARCATEA